MFQFKETLLTYPINLGFKHFSENLKLVRDYEFFCVVVNALLGLRKENNLFILLQSSPSIVYC